MRENGRTAESGPTAHTDRGVAPTKVGEADASTLAELGAPGVVPRGRAALALQSSVGNRAVQRLVEGEQQQQGSQQPETQETESAESQSEETTPETTPEQAPAPQARPRGHSGKFPPPRTVQVLGSQGENVDKLQTMPKDLGFSEINPDGDYGKLTQGAVREFQASFGLARDGKVGPRTWVKMARLSGH